MPLTLAFHFPWRRYHATPWSSNPNSSAVELPPSPWRILRALYAVWKERSPRLLDGTEIPESIVHDLLTSLAATEPNYVLPPYDISHTRHYYPDGQHRSVPGGSTDRALDSFAVLGADATLYIRWAIDLPAEQEKALARLVSSLPYLGRADSICDAHVERAEIPHEEHQPVRPLHDDAELGPTQRRVDVLAPTLPLDLDALLMRPAEVRAKGLLYPPGTRHVEYALPAPRREQPKPRTDNRPRRTSASLAHRRVTSVLLSVHGTPQPRMVDTVAVTDALRMASLKLLGDNQRGSALVGKEADNTRSRSNHQHAHFLALPENNGTGTMSNLAVWTPQGFTNDDLAALNSLATRTVGAPRAIKSAPHDLQVRTIAYGGHETLPTQLTAPSRTWVSCTPYVPTRHHKRSQSWHAYLQEIVTRELGYRRIDTPVHVTLEDPPKDFVRYRRKRLPRTHGSSTSERAETRQPLCLRLEFEDDITGPLALGALNHFGLGLFRHA